MIALGQPLSAQSWTSHRWAWIRVTSPPTATNQRKSGGDLRNRQPRAHDAIQQCKHMIGQGYLRSRVSRTRTWQSAQVLFEPRSLKMDRSGSREEKEAAVPAGKCINVKRYWREIDKDKKELQSWRAALNAAFISPACDLASTGRPAPRLGVRGRRRCSQGGRGGK